MREFVKERLVRLWVEWRHGNRALPGVAHDVAVREVELDLGHVEGTEGPRSVPCRHRRGRNVLPVGLAQDEPVWFEDKPYFSTRFIGLVFVRCLATDRDRTAQHDGLLTLPHLAAEFAPSLIRGQRPGL